jgi:predicted ester cyclase
VARYVGLLAFPPTNISGRPVVCGNQKKLGEQLSALAYLRNHQSQIDSQRSGTANRHHQLPRPPKFYGEEIKMFIGAHKAIVRRYFEEALDRRNLDVLDEIVNRDCIIHRPEVSEPIRGLEAFKHTLERILQTYSEFTTTIHDLIAEEDRVACRLSHRAINRGDWTSRLGRHAVAGKTGSWTAIAIFRIRDGRLQKNG